MPRRPFPLRSAVTPALLAFVLCALGAPASGQDADPVLSSPADPDVERAEGGKGLHLATGKGGKDTRAAICRLDEMPWKPTRLVEVGRKKGADVELAAGTYLVQTGRRNGDGEVHVTLQVVTVEDGSEARATIPGPKSTKPTKDGSAYVRVLRYPRK